MAHDALPISRRTMAEADRFFGGGRALPPASAPRPRRRAHAEVVAVRNDTDMELRAGYVVGLAGLVVAPEDRPEDWAEDETHIAVPPEPGTYPCAVVVDDVLPAGGLGYAQTYGQARLWIEVADPAHRFAAAVEGDPTHVRSADAGPFQLRHAPAVAGLCETLAYFPAGGDGVVAEAVKLAYAVADGSNGTVRLRDVALLADAAAAPNWTLAGPAYEARYLAGASPAEG